MPKTIYLDSSDFSDLSKPPSEIRPEDARLLAELRRAKREGKIECLLSPIHLSEAVHAAPDARIKAAAQARAELMHELCDGNYLSWPTNIIEKELNGVISVDCSEPSSVVDIMSGPGEYFGLKVDEIRRSREELRAQMKESLKKAPWSRKDRRRILAGLDLRRGSGRERWKALIQELLATKPPLQFPFDLLSQEIFLRWMAEEASDAEVTDQLLRLMSDPRILIGYLVDETGHRQVLYDILRSGGSRLIDNLSRGLNHALETLHILNQPIWLTEFRRRIPDILSSLEIPQKLISAFAPSIPTPLSQAEIGSALAKSPALSVLSKTISLYLQRHLESLIQKVEIGSTKSAKLKESDFGDLIHVIYAPYVDIFRCDASFGALLQQQQRIKARVLPRRGELFAAITS